MGLAAASGSATSVNPFAGQSSCAFATPISQTATQPTTAATSNQQHPSSSSIVGKVLANLPALGAMQLYAAHAAAAAAAAAAANQTPLFGHASASAMARPQITSSKAAAATQQLVQQQQQQTSSYIGDQQTNLSSNWCLFVYNLAPETEDKVLWKLFGPFGAVQEVSLARDSTTNKCKGYAFVTMPNYNQALASIQALNGSLLANRVLQVSFKTSPANSANKKKRVRQ